MRTLITLIIAIVSVAVIGFAINAFAHGGMGMGWGNDSNHSGQGRYHRGGYGPGYSDQLSEEENQQFAQQRETFLRETRALRDNIFDKERELQNELAKQEPDAAKASTLQKEISELQAQLDQKRIDHMVEFRKQNPNAGRGFMRDGGHMMMGYGQRGYCWQ